jgi:hypothetical protein
MPELTLLNAPIIGGIIAAIWATVALRRTFRRSVYLNLSSAGRKCSWAVGVLVFPVAFYVSLVISTALAFFLLNAVNFQGAVGYYLMPIFVAFGIGVLGAALTYAGAVFSAKVALSLARHNAA